MRNRTALFAATLTLAALSTVALSGCGSKPEEDTTGVNAPATSVQGGGASNQNAATPQQRNTTIQQ